MPHAVGIDLGGSKIAAAIVHEDGRVGARIVVPNRVDGRDGLASVVRTLVADLGPHDPVGLGMGAAGLIDYSAGRYLFGPNTELGSLDMASELSEATGLDVRVDNDANCATWAEHRYGSGRGTRHFLCVTLGTGIGGGMVLDGRPYRGAHGGAGEIGHMLMDPTGPPCGCGRTGCWEQMASGPALQREARAAMRQRPDGALLELSSGEPETITGPMVTLAARQGDEAAAAAVRSVATWIGRGLASLVNVLEPERIAVAGGLSRDWDLFARTAVEEMTHQMEASSHRPVPAVVPAELGADAGVVGAAMLVLGGA